MDQQRDRACASWKSKEGIALLEVRTHLTPVYKQNEFLLIKQRKIDEVKRQFGISRYDNKDAKQTSSFRKHEDTNTGKNKNHKHQQVKKGEKGT